MTFVYMHFLKYILVGDDNVMLLSYI